MCNYRRLYLDFLFFFLIAGSMLDSRTLLLIAGFMAAVYLVRWGISDLWEKR